MRELLKRGIFRNFALTTGCARKGPWRMSKVKWVNIALPDKHFESLGLSFPLELNLPDQPNRAVRTRMLRGVGGAVRLLPIPIGCIL
jgi:hypothetical protein